VEDVGAAPIHRNAAGSSAQIREPEAKVVGRSSRRRKSLGEEPKAGSRTGVEAKATGVRGSGVEARKRWVSGPHPRGEGSRFKSAVPDQVSRNGSARAGYVDLVRIAGPNPRIEGEINHHIHVDHHTRNGPRSVPGRARLY